MGTYREGGYSATVHGYFVVAGESLRLAKTNGRTFDFAQPHVLPPNTEGDLILIVDHEPSSTRVMLPDGATLFETTVSYLEVAPF